MKEYKEVNRLIKYGLPLLVVVLWLLSFWVIPLIKGQPQSVGEFGDMFGSLDTLFSGLAFAGLIIAIAYQRIELQIQREELKLQRKELSISNTELQKQREQLESQSNTFKKQNFESSFFRILELHNSILQEIIFNKCRGREAITRLNEDITADYNRSNKYLQELTNIRTDFIDKHKKDPDDKESKSIDLQALQETFSYLFEDHLNVVGHYFRNLFHLFKYVDRSKDLIDNRYDYIKIVRAQLSSDELCLLLYNCLTKRGMDFKPIVEKYSLLKNMDSSRLCDLKLKKHFKSKAFN